MTALLAVVGTDTCVGKTIVASALLWALRQAGHRVAGFKAVETGINATTSVPSTDPPDWLLLERASGQRLGTALGASFPLPAAPLAAARASGSVFSLDAIERKLHRLMDEHELVLLEGAGGLHVPLAEKVLWIDVLDRWRPNCLLVGRLGLGTINHTLLSLESLRHRGLEPLGVLLSALEEPGPEASYTPDLLAEFGSIRVFDPLPHGLVLPEEGAAHLRQNGVLARVTELLS